MYTLGYAFKPWTEAKAIADGPSILKYVRETAAEHGIDRHIRFGHQVEGRRLVERRRPLDGRGRAQDGETVPLHLQLPVPVRRLLLLRRRLHAGVPGHRALQGRAGPSAEVARGPRLRRQAGRRDRLRRDGGDAGAGDGQDRRRTSPCCSARRPTWSRGPAEDAMANRLRKVLPAKLAYAITRWQNVLFGMYFFRLARSKPDAGEAELIGMVAPAARPRLRRRRRTSRRRYNPWDQRLCLVPDADLFEAIKAGHAPRSSPTRSRRSPRPASG